ncbi:hypothetical protein CONCODRAFT_5981 [Conidiobolus coronatus NRRL 28638]|uniref:FAD dependent oxidoreductase domain-containing protein n=1 Tax=Conidiobolus coronatus (strain ATCC 28846 / CBS 209.66 / NRRL 28638) TaxID=796925 RepID=A0A137P8T9_CONC2|nr:hypothetical protein CONCODRAFT_5981 [Conidiobolus coronatus NRRL 28638]|eukprot:KXN71341.1 hypothetical protein CONCODRAFT_5981 [Conidiobolus coronatus NRRL 28638]
MHRENWEIESFRMCWYADSWDNHFYFDHVPNREGLFVATGDSGHGMKFAPEIGKVILECIERKDGKYYNQFKWRSKPKDFKLYIDRCEVDYSELPLSELEWIKGGKRFESRI